MKYECFVYPFTSNYISLATLYQQLFLFIGMCKFILSANHTCITYQESWLTRPSIETMKYMYNHFLLNYEQCTTCTNLFAISIGIIFKADMDRRLGNHIVTKSAKKNKSNTEQQSFFLTITVSCKENKRNKIYQYWKIVYKSTYKYI